MDTEEKLRLIEAVEADMNKIYGTELTEDPLINTWAGSIEHFLSLIKERLEQ